MILGLDVGGTQTDGVVLDGNRLISHGKTATGSDLLETLSVALEKTLSGLDNRRIERMVFSTTLATNAIVQDALDDAGMIVSAGPGMDPSWFATGPAYHVVPGCIDHRGTELLALDESSVLHAAHCMEALDIGAVGIVGKFSVRNPLHELQIAKWLRGRFAHVALGHRASGRLSFPRRIDTTYLNAALYPLHRRFVGALEQTLRQRRLDAPSYLLKPDGGTILLSESDRLPARTAQSGPAASVMGALALDGCKGTCLVLDIGGTTTDMALVLDGIPLLVPRGITLGPFRTSIRSLLTRSIGVGGDSEVRTSSRQKLRVGPLRRGLPMAMGGPSPTATDAMVVLGLMPTGDRARAENAMDLVGGPVGWTCEQTADRVLKKMAETIALSARAFVHAVNARPAYTIYEVLTGEIVRPDCAVLLGGPAKWLAPYVSRALDLPCRVPEYHEVANAVGAAAARVTSEVTLQADTEQGRLVVPEMGLEQAVERDFDLEEALGIAETCLRRRALAEGGRPEEFFFNVTENEVFHMIRGMSRTGKNIRLRLSVVPGLIAEWMDGKQETC